MMMYILDNENVIKKWHSKILKILYLKIVITIIISQYDKTEKDPCNEFMTKGNSFRNTVKEKRNFI